MKDFFGYDSPEDAKASYEREGYLILKSWFSGQQVGELINQAKQLWSLPRNEKLVVDFGSGELANQRMLLKDAPAFGAYENHKINDLFLESDQFRSVFLGNRLSSLLGSLLGGAPCACNSLHFTYGSEQRAHFDTWYMPPPVADKMAVVSVALEPYTADNGPLYYYPRSHLLPKYRFSNGHIRAIEVEMPNCDKHVFGEIEKAGIEKKVFYCDAGDVFVWHSQLLHGAEPHLNKNMTRRSIVVHYWRHNDIDSNAEYPWLHGLERPSYDGYYVNRPHQNVGKVIDQAEQAKRLGLATTETKDYELLKAQFDDLLQDRIAAQTIMESQLSQINQLKAEVEHLRNKGFQTQPKPVGRVLTSWLNRNTQSE